MTLERRIFPTEQELLGAAAKTITGVLRNAVADKGSATFVLSGGSTPKGLYQLLASQMQADVDWKKVQFFWGDERSVPPDHPDSNFRMANDALFSRMEVPAANVHRIRAELSPGQAASAYEAEIRTVLGLQENDFPRFDVLLLGLGEDGHTASLFPGTSALIEHSRIVVANDVPQLATRRITMTLPALNSARVVLFLVSGSSKVDIVRDVLEGPPDRYPSQRVAPRETLYWYLDASAAGKLPEGTT